MTKRNINPTASGTVPTTEEWVADQIAKGHAVSVIGDKLIVFAPQGLFVPMRVRFDARHTFCGEVRDWEAGEVRTFTTPWPMPPVLAAYMSDISATFQYDRENDTVCLSPEDVMLLALIDG